MSEPTKPTRFNWDHFKRETLPALLAGLLSGYGGASLHCVCRCEPSAPVVTTVTVPAPMPEK